LYSFEFLIAVSVEMITSASIGLSFFSEPRLKAKTSVTCLFFRYLVLSRRISLSSTKQRVISPLFLTPSPAKALRIILFILSG